MKLLFVSSSGGHWEELMCLKEIAEKHDSVFVTEEGGQTDGSALPNLHVFPQINRHERFILFKLLRLFLRAGQIIRNEKPDFLITTGALLSFPFCLYAKAAKVKIIYIESFARVKDGSMTGKWVYRFADLFLVQWEELLEVYPKAVYVGSIF